MCDSILCLKYRKYSSLCYQAQRRQRRSISCLGYSKRLKCKAPLMVPWGRREDDTTLRLSWGQHLYDRYKNHQYKTDELKPLLSSSSVWKSVWFNFTLVNFSFDVVLFLKTELLYFHSTFSCVTVLDWQGHLTSHCNMSCTTVAYFAATPDFLMQYQSSSLGTNAFL